MLSSQASCGLPRSGLTQSVIPAQRQSQASFTLPAHDENVVTLFHLAVLYKRYNRKLRGQSYLALKLAAGSNSAELMPVYKGQPAGRDRSGILTTCYVCDQLREIQKGASSIQQLTQKRKTAAKDVCKLGRQ